MVRRFSVKEAQSLYEYRVALETEATFLAAERIDAIGRACLVQLIESHASSMAVQSFEGYIPQSSDSDFHGLVAKLSQSDRIIEVLTKNLYPQLMLLRQQHKKVLGRGQVALLEHQRIAEAIHQGDGLLARLLMRRHLEFSWTALCGQLKNLEENSEI